MAVDPTYVTKNYEKDGGDTWVINGTLELGPNGVINFDSGAQVQAGGAQAAAITPPASTASTNTTPYGYSTQAQADAVVTAVRAIITALHNAGITG